MAEFINALRQGMADQTDWQQTDTRRKAGKSFAAGDYGAASGILAGEGMLPEAAQMRGYGQQEQAGQAEAAAKERKDRTEWMLNGAEGLKRVRGADEATTLANRVKAFDRYLVPTLQAMGAPADAIEKLRNTPMTDEALDSFMATLGAEADKLQAVQRGNGGYDVLNMTRGGTVLRSVEPQANQPNAPAGYRFKPDGGLEFIPGGPADPRVVGDRAQAGRRPRAPRGGGNGSRDGGRGETAPVDEWEPF